MSGGVWECGKPVGFSIISMPQSEGGGDFLFKAPKGPLFGSPFPPFPPAGDPHRSGFSFCYFFFWR